MSIFDDANIGKTLEDSLAINVANNELLFNIKNEISTGNRSFSNFTKETADALKRLSAGFTQSTDVAKETAIKSAETTSILNVVKTEVANSNKTSVSNGKIITSILNNSNNLQDNLRTSVSYPLKTMNGAIGALAASTVLLSKSVKNAVMSVTKNTLQNLTSSFDTFGKDLHGISLKMDGVILTIAKSALAVVKLGANLILAPIKALGQSLMGFLQNSLIGKLTAFGLMAFGLYKFFTGTEFGRVIGLKIKEGASYLVDKITSSDFFQDVVKPIVGTITAVAAARKAAQLLYQAQVLTTLKQIAINTAAGGMGGGLFSGFGGKGGGKGLGKFLKGPGGRILGGITAGFVANEAIQAGSTALGADENTSSLMGNTLGTALSGAMMGGKAGPLGALIGAAIGSWYTAFTEKGGILDMASEMINEGVGTTFGHIFNGLKISLFGEDDYWSSTMKNVNQTSNANAIPNISTTTSANAVQRREQPQIVTVKSNDNVNTKLADAAQANEKARHNDASKMQAELQKANELNSKLLTAFNDLSTRLVDNARYAQQTGQVQGAVIPATAG